MIRNVSCTIATLVTVLSLTQVTLADNLSGVVLSADDKPVSGALVIVLDGATGIPVIAADKPAGSSMGFLSTLSSSTGTFALIVSPGNYHVLAQQWDNPETPWENMIIFDDAQHYGVTVKAAGAARNVTVPSAAAQNLKLTPPGKSEVSVHFKSGNDDTLVVISQSPPDFDPVLRFVGWPGDFLTSAIAFNRAPAGNAVFTNLPAGKLYLAMFGNDNNPGFASAEVTVPEGGSTSVTMEWVAPWSDARRTPPARLQPLYEKFKKNAWTDESIEALQNLPDDIGRNPLALRKLLLGAPQPATLPDGSTARLADVVTVLAYLRLQSRFQQVLPTN